MNKLWQMERRWRNASERLALEGLGLALQWHPYHPSASELFLGDGSEVQKVMSTITTLSIHAFKRRITVKQLIPRQQRNYVSECAEPNHDPCKNAMGGRHSDGTAKRVGTWGELWQLGHLCLFALVSRGGIPRKLKLPPLRQPVTELYAYGGGRP